MIVSPLMKCFVMINFMINSAIILSNLLFDVKNIHSHSPSVASARSALHHLYRLLVREALGLLRSNGIDVDYGQAMDR